MTLKKLTVVCERFPSPAEPVFTFVDDLVSALSDLGTQVTVISPQSLTRVFLRDGHRAKRRWVRETSGGTSFAVLQPWYISFSGTFRKLGKSSYRRAVERAMRKAGAADAVYAHFWFSAVAAGAYLLGTGNEGAGRLFVGCGESELRARLCSEVRRISRTVGGVISVSGKNKADCVSMYGIDDKDIAVLPNGVDERLFYRRDDRAELRRALGLSEKDFAVAFVGWFDQRKGVKRLEEALKGLTDVKVIYIGYGDLTPGGDNIVYCGRVAHEEIARYLNAADVFVLPTRAEGCCNAIVEAMACGLPVISSSGAFNDDLLAPDRSLRVDPDDIAAIREAVQTLRDEPARARAMGEAAYAFALGLTVKERAKKIKAFIENRLDGACTK